MKLNNEKGMMLIWLYLMTAVLLIMTGSLFTLSFQESRLTNIHEKQNEAFHIAEAGIDQILQNIRTSGPTTLNTNIGNGAFNAAYDSTNKTITSVGTVEGISKTLVARVSKLPPVGVRGALTANSAVNLKGNIHVDGRDYDADGNLTGDPGTYGVSSGGLIDPSGSSEIGGNGIAPAHPPNPASYEQNATDNIFTSPEETLGLPVGSLDIYKTSTPPPTPFTNQIVYLTGDWIEVNFSGSDGTGVSTGILIVHNDTNSALLKNIHGKFRGIIIADDLVHINGQAEIVGGVILQKTSGNTVGNGDAYVKYSSEVLSNLPVSDFKVYSWEECKVDEQNC